MNIDCSSAEVLSTDWTLHWTQLAKCKKNRLNMHCQRIDFLLPLRYLNNSFTLSKRHIPYFCTFHVFRVMILINRYSISARW